MWTVIMSVGILPIQRRKAGAISTDWTSPSEPTRMTRTPSIVSWTVSRPRLKTSAVTSCSLASPRERA
jgi:hypothetical protein